MRTANCCSFFFDNNRGSMYKAGQVIRIEGYIGKSPKNGKLVKVIDVDDRTVRHSGVWGKGRHNFQDEFCKDSLVGMSSIVIQESE